MPLVFVASITQQVVALHPGALGISRASQQVAALQLYPRHARVADHPRLSSSGSSYALVPKKARLSDEDAWERNKPFSIPHRFRTAHWWRTMRTLPESEVLRRIRQPVLLATLYGLIVSALYRLLSFLPTMSFRPHSLMSSALSLLLVFRTNAAYTRFWEGRQSWQQLADHVRSLSRYTMLFERQLGRARRCRVARLLCAFPIVLKQHLRGSSAVPNVRALLTESEISSLRAAHNQPLHLVNLLGLQLASVPDQTDPAAPFSSRERLMMLKIVAQLSDCIGACERIVLTPVPLHYARHTSRLATIFVASLPLVLARELGFVLAPTMAIICWGLFGIQEIGLLIEDPFRTVLKLDKMCMAIQRDVQQTLEASMLRPEAEGAASGGVTTNASAWKGKTVDVTQAADAIRDLASNALGLNGKRNGAPSAGAGAGMPAAAQGMPAASAGGAATAEAEEAASGVAGSIRDARKKRELYSPLDVEVVEGLGAKPTDHPPGKSLDELILDADIIEAEASASRMIC